MTPKTQVTILFGVVAIAATLQVQTAAGADAPSAFEQQVQEIKNPVSWLSWGADLRLRNEYSHNISSLRSETVRNEQDYFRFRARLWASATIMTNLTLNGRMAAEPREWMNPSFSKQYVGRSGMEWRYGIVDNLNAQWKYILDTPLSISAGRQDIMLGDPLDWWLVADGTPSDGSWTFFLDSVRMSYDARPIKTKVDLIYINQRARPDDWLPTIDNSTAYSLTDQNEQGAILYVSNKSVENTQIDGYFIYKGDDKQFSTGDNADIYTAGGKVTGTVMDHLKYSVEGAYQFGWKEDKVSGVFKSRALDAYGAKAEISCALKDKLNNTFSLVGEYLSGDDSGTSGTDEMFDVLWGRWPRWSELYIYSYATETGGRIAQLNNVGRFGPKWTFSPTKQTTFSVMYNAMFAPQEVASRAGANSGLFSGDGNFRGHYLQALVKHQFNKHISAHLWSEFVWQGDYYTSHDLTTFLRAEVLFTF